MRVLTLTNYYPPSDYGWGYMQLCEEVTDGLWARGHQVAVLTSTYRQGEEKARPYPVHRVLPIDPDWNKGQSAAWQFFVGRRRREWAAVDHLKRVAVDFRPDVIVVWHAIGLPRALLKAAEAMDDVATVYYLAGYLPELPDEHAAFWKKEPVHWTAKLFKRPLAALALKMLAWEGKPVPLRYENVICVSEYVRERLVAKGLIPDRSVVIHNGVDIETFSPDGMTPSPKAAGRLRCLVAGRMRPEKGVHTAIEAFARLCRPGGEAARLSLTLLGDGPASYVGRLKRQVAAAGLEEVVTFRPPVPRAEMPAILIEHDVLLLPSEYEEPIARAMQEGMAMGLLVIGTVTGGSGELLVHEETGLVFEAGDPRSLAATLSRALHEPDLARAVAREGQKRVREAFTIEKTIARIEAYLRRVTGEEDGKGEDGFGTAGG